MRPRTSAWCVVPARRQRGCVCDACIGASCMPCGGPSGKAAFRCACGERLCLTHTRYSPVHRSVTRAAHTFDVPDFGYQKSPVDPTNNGDITRKAFTYLVMGAAGVGYATAAKVAVRDFVDSMNASADGAWQRGRGAICCWVAPHAARSAGHGQRRARYIVHPGGHRCDGQVARQAAVCAPPLRGGD